MTSKMKQDFYNFIDYCVNDLFIYLFQQQHHLPKRFYFIDGGELNFLFVFYFDSREDQFW